jgi:hypothetical protein
MSGSGDSQSAKEIAAKEAQEKELKAAQEVTGKAPSRSNGESSDDSSSDSDSDSDSSDEDVKDDDDEAKKAADGTKYYGYPKIVITSDYHIYDDPDIFLVAFWIYFMKENGYKINWCFEKYFCEGKWPQIMAITSHACQPCSLRLVASASAQ